jgi:hypothetical protein
MKFMLLLYADSKWLVSEDLLGLVNRHVDYFKSLGGKVAEGGILNSPDRGLVLERTRTGERHLPAPVYDGPLVLGGYYVVDVEDLAEAEAVAMGLPMVEKVTIEIRAMMGHVQGPI